MLNSYLVGALHEQWSSFVPKEFKPPGVGSYDKEAGGITRMKADCKVAVLAAKFKYTNNNRFSSKKQAVKKDALHPDRDKEKEDFTSAEDSPLTQSVSVKPNLFWRHDELRP